MEEETDTNELTRFERFQKWAKESLLRISAVAISAAGIITTIVVAARKALKTGGRAVGKFGKALANIGKKLAPFLGAVLSLVGSILSLGAKALHSWPIIFGF